MTGGYVTYETWVSLRFGLHNEMTLPANLITMKEWEQIDLLQRLYHRVRTHKP